MCHNQNEKQHLCCVVANLMKTERMHKAGYRRGDSEFQDARKCIKTEFQMRDRNPHTLLEMAKAP